MKPKEIAIHYGDEIFAVVDMVQGKIRIATKYKSQEEFIEAHGQEAHDQILSTAKLLYKLFKEQEGMYA